MPTTEKYNDHIVQLFLLAAAVWGIIGMSWRTRRCARHGRTGVMPPWRHRLTEDQARLIAAWLYAKASDEKKNGPG